MTAGDPEDQHPPRTIELSSRTVSQACAGAKMVVVQHWTRLLEIVDHLLKFEEFGTAIIVAQTACEVVMAQAISKASAAQPAAAPSKPRKAKKKGRIRTFSPSNESVRNRYGSLTGDTLDQLPFWTAYLNMVDDRHDAVHKAAKIPAGAARAGVDSARQLVNHIVQHNGLT